MRIRTIKPEFWTDEKVGEWDAETRLAYIWTWSAADDYGRLRISPALLRSGAFTYHDMTIARAREILATLTRTSRIVMYEVDGETYGQVVSWEKHQKVDKPGKFQNPSPDQGVIVDSRQSRDSLATVSPCTGSGSGWDQGSGREQDLSTPSESLAPSPRKTKAPKQTLRLDCTTWEWIGITDEIRAGWRQDYPAVDIEAELGKARGWVRADPKRKKSNWTKFLAGWFSRAQDRGGNGQSNAPRIDYRAIDSAAEREWQRVLQAGQSNDFQKIGFAVEMLHERTLAALRTIDKDPANAVWKMADIPIRDQLTYKAVFIPAWKASGIPYEVESAGGAP